MIPPPITLALSPCYVPCYPLVKWKVMACTVRHEYRRGRGRLEGQKGAGGHLTLLDHKSETSPGHAAHSGHGDNLPSQPWPLEPSVNCIVSGLI